MKQLDSVRGERLIRIMAERKTGVRELARRTGMSPSTISGHRKGAEMTASQIVMVCQELGCSSDVLLGLPQSSDQELIGLVQQLSEGQRELVKAVIRELR